MEAGVVKNLKEELSDIATSIKEKRNILSVKPVDFSTEVFMIAGDYLATGMLDGRGVGLAGIRKITLSPAIENIEVNAFKNLGTIEEVLTEGGALTTIGDDAFNGCTSLVDAIFAEGLETIGNKSFASCGFSAFNIPSSVINIGDNAFYNCSKLTEVFIPKKVSSCGVDPITKMQGNAFAGCGKLESITVEEGSASFYNGNGINALIKKDDNVLISACKNTQIPDYVNVLGICAFQGFTLTDFTIPSQITDIGEKCFNASSISTINFDVGCRLTRFENGVFAASSLKKIKFPEGIISVGNYCFQYCSKLTEVIFSKGIQTIGAGAFSSCPAVTKYDFSNFEGVNLPTLSSSNSLQVSNNCWIVVPNDRLDEWKDHTNWLNYKDRIKSVEEYNNMTSQ